MDDSVFFQTRKQILEACRKATDITKNKESQRELTEILKETHQLWPENLWGIIMSIRGRVLKYWLPMQQLSALGDACWVLREESDKEDDRIFFGRLVANLRLKTCEVFATVLSGGEVSCRNEKGWKNFSLTRIPTTVRETEGIRFSISRKNTEAIFRAYDRLIKKADEENNELAATHWKTQKETFRYLLEHNAPKLLETAPLHN